MSEIPTSTQENLELVSNVDQETAAERLRRAQAMEFAQLDIELDFELAIDATGM